VPSLAEIQRGVRRAVVTGEVGHMPLLLFGGGDVTTRLKIHHRHYRASLIEALLGKFPATAWLVGAGFTTDAAEQFLREQPPRALCIAEYGEAFPAFLGERPVASNLGYLRSFAELEWHLGQVSLAGDAPPLGLEALANVEGAALADAVVALQPGMRYLEVSWPVDQLMTLFLTGNVPERLEIAPADVWLEIRGARGQFVMPRLTATAFAFRQALHSGRSLGAAAELALDAGGQFDPGAALTDLVSDGVLTAITLPNHMGDRGHDRS